MAADGFFARKHDLENPHVETAKILKFACFAKKR
jgi:hypothetical protein